MPGESRRTRPRGIRLSSSSVTLATSRPTRVAIVSRRFGGARELAGQPDLLGRERHFDQFYLDPGGRPGKTMRKLSSAVANRS